MPRRLRLVRKVRGKLPKIWVSGVGWIEVSRLPARIPKVWTVVGGVKKPVTKPQYLQYWAHTHQTAADAKKRKASFIKEMKRKAM